MLHLSGSRCVPSLALVVGVCLGFSGCAPGATGPASPTGSLPPASLGPSVSPTRDRSPAASGMPSPSTPIVPVFSRWQRLDIPEPLPHVYGGSDIVGAASIGAGYVAVGSVIGGCCDGGFSTDSHGVVWRSADGITWQLEPRTAVFDLAHLVGLASNGHRLVAIGATITDDAGLATYHGSVWTSDDGLAWQRQAVEPMFNAVTATADGFVAATGGSEGPEVWASTDGLHWSLVVTSSALGPGVVEAMAATPAGTVAVGSGSPADASMPVAAAWRSVDGVQWLLALSQPSLAGASMDAIAVSGSSIVAVGNDAGFGAAVWRSEDGLTWTRALGSAMAVAGTSILGVVGGWRGFIVVGSIEGNIPGRIAWQSADGIAWSELDAPAGLGVDRLTGVQAGDAIVLFTRVFDERLGRAVPQAWAVR